MVVSLETRSGVDEILNYCTKLAIWSAPKIENCHQSNGFIQESDVFHQSIVQSNMLKSNCSTPHPFAAAFSPCGRGALPQGVHAPWFIERWPLLFADRL